MKVKNYSCFQRNRKGVKIMGGVATLVSNEVKSKALRVTEEEENDEFLVIRLGHVEPAVNIINVYGGIENRMTKQEVTENWVRMYKEITKIEERDEGVVLIGDMNCGIGNHNLGVKGNHPTVSYGGSLRCRDYNSTAIKRDAQRRWGITARKVRKQITWSDLRPVVSPVLQKAPQRIHRRKALRAAAVEAD